MELWGWCKLALDNVMKQELEQCSSSGHYKWGRQLPGEWENWWVQSVGESRRKISLRNTFQITYLWTDELGDHLSRRRSNRLLQTATELQLIVRLFSVRTPALQLGFGGRKFRLWLEVTLFLFLVHINIYIHILIHLNHLARAWEKAATVRPGGAGAQRRFWCWKVCKLCPTVWEGDWILGFCVTSQKAIGSGCGATSSSFPSWSAFPAPFSTPLLPWRQGIQCFLSAGGSLVVSLYPHKDLLKEAWVNKLMPERDDFAMAMSPSSSGPRTHSDPWSPPGGL